MTAIPCGQKKRRREMIQSQTVTPPLAAIEGTTLRLKTATTNSRTRSRRPRARMRCGCAVCAVVDKVLNMDASQPRDDCVVKDATRRAARPGPAAGKECPPQDDNAKLVPDFGW